MSTSPTPSSMRDALARALAQIRQLRTQVHELERAGREPIAIVGLGCRLPGGIDAPDQLRDRLREGFDAVGEIPSDRWDLGAYFDADVDAPGKMYTRRGAFLTNVADFDPELFGISPREAVSMDPQQRIFLEVVHAALESAGIDVQALEGSNTGVFAGVTSADYGVRQLQSLPLEDLDPYFLSGNLASFVAGRVSYTFGLHGPSLSVDTACSSSLVAVHLAIAALRRGETNLAIAGGVNLMLVPEWNVVLSRAKMMAPDGRCKTFDASADGYVRGEGCGVVVLKRLADALRDGDRIEAVIRGSAINQDGPASGITVPNGLAQQRVIEAALQDADVEPQSIGYVEAHGTGTSLGDPIEVRSLAAVYGEARESDNPLRLGSIKTNMGHLEPAAGIAGLIKVVLALQNRELYPHLHLDEVNPELDLASIPAEIPTKRHAWERVGENPRRAAVSSFGASGTNGHIVLEEAPPAGESVAAQARGGPEMLVLSARTEDARDALALMYAEQLRDATPAQWAELCSASQRHRSTLAQRMAVVASSPEQAVATLGKSAEGRPAQGAHTARAQSMVPRVAFLFSGQGSQTLKMGAELRTQEPVFAEAFAACESIVDPLLPHPLAEVIDGRHDETMLGRTEFTQPALFAVQYALAALWKSWGVEPSAVLGHSVGEYVAATLAGVFDLEAGLRLVVARGRLMQALPGDGGMLSLKTDEPTARALIEGYADSVSLAAINGPSSVVIAGSKDVLAHVQAAADARGMKSKALNVSHGFHSPQMDTMLDAFESEVPAKLGAPSLPMASNVSGALADANVQDARYWRDHVRQPVRFADGLRAVAELGIDTFVELGGQPTLTSMAHAILPESSVVLPSLRAGRNEREQMLDGLAALYVRGVRPRWDALSTAPAQRVRLPAYPYQRRRFWVPNLESTRAASSTCATSTLEHPLLDTRVPNPLADAHYNTHLSLTRNADLADFVIEQVNVVNIGVYLELTRAAFINAWPDVQGVEITKLSIERACVLTPQGVDLQVVFREATDDIRSFSISSVQRDGSCMEHCGGLVRAAGSADPALEQPRDVTVRMTGDALYHAMEARGIELGPAARWIETIESTSSRSAATLRGPTKCDGGDGCGVFDAVFQAAFAVLPQDAAPDAAYMLVGASCIRMHTGGTPRRAVVHRVRWDARARAVTVDACALDDRGQVVFEVRGAMLKHASRDLIRAQLQAASAELPRHSKQTRALGRNAALAVLSQARPDVVRRYVIDGAADVLGFEPDAVDPKLSLLDLGLDSLMAVELKRALEVTFGTSIPLVDLLEGPSIEELTVTIVAALGPASEATTTEQLATLEPDPAQRFDPFTLTDLQQAYLIGRGSDFSLGNVSTHFFIEVELNAVDLARMETAWNTLVERHDMLRAVFAPDGTQRVLPEVSRYTIEREDLRSRGEQDRQAALKRTASKVRNRVFETDAWPMFEIRASVLDDRTTRLHLGFDALIVDAWSTSMLFSEWADAYRGAQLPPVTVRFADYMRAFESLRRSEAYTRDSEYWDARIDTLPAAPELPLRCDPHTLERPEFGHRTTRLDTAAWEALQASARAAKVTPSAAICAAYALTLATWSRSRHFTLNLLFFNRLPLHDDVRKIAGNFSSTSLLEIDTRGSLGFTELAQRVQRQLANDLEHSLVTGVEVLRRINRRQREHRNASMPVVFASTISLRSQDDDVPFGLASHLARMGEGGREIASDIRTPQVWLDHQVLEEDGELVVNWDVVEALFPEGTVDVMFERYEALLHELAANPTAWSRPLQRAPLPAKQLEARGRRNETQIPIAPRLLQEGFIEQVGRQPDAPAVITTDRTLTYAELDTASERLAHALLDQGVSPAEPVAVVMHKGWEQIVAVLAIHKAGGAYLPIDPALPSERIAHLVSHAGVQRAITQPAVDDTIDWPDTLPRVRVEGTAWQGRVSEGERLRPTTDPDALAYIIYTSGSTGMPKGVAISHAAAWNTIADINGRFEIGSHDRTLGISSLSFDLSVYDVFGLLSAGGAVVVPAGAEARDPSAWVDLIRMHAVTVWNSVPALMQMLCEHVASVGLELVPLKLAMLSGDWIPVTLPDAIRAIAPRTRVISLGGATEASIWSIHFPIDSVPQSWTSIPYGRPLANQRFHVLDDDLEPRPTWVPGDLYIAGDGLAMGYWNDPERTAASFFEHPRSGERLYRTGDKGRYLPDGDIEFLGREDTQVKVQGYRIELGEIEAAMGRIDGVEVAVAAVHGERAGTKTLVGYFVPVDATQFDEVHARERLADMLPPYMMPSSFITLDALPLTGNGKVNRKALPTVQTTAAADVRERVLPRSDRERALAKIWAELLEIDEVGVTEDFFDLGGQSFLAMRMMAQIRAQLGVSLPLSALLERGTIERLATLLSDPAAQAWSPRVQIREQADATKTLVLVHPVGGNVLCYADLARSFDGNVVGMQARGLEAGEDPLRGIAEMAATYVDALLSRPPGHPFVLAGWSLGGVVAFEMARMLEQRGEAPASVVMIDSRLERADRLADTATRMRGFMDDLARVGGRSFPLEADVLDERGHPKLDAVYKAATTASLLPEGLGLDAFARLWAVYDAGIESLGRYEPGALDAPLIELVAAQEAHREVRLHWRDLTRGPHRTQTLPGDHYEVVTPSNREAVLDRLASSFCEPSA